MAIKSALGRQLGTQFDSVFDVVKSNPIYDKSGSKIPSLDLNFAKSKSLRDSRSTKNKITFSRASSATYVGADGLIKTTPVNLIIYSEQFDNSAWTKFSGATVNLNAVTAPDGTNTGSIVNFSAGSSRFSQTRTLTAGTYTLSAFLRVSSGSKALTMQVFNSTDGSQNKNITVTDSWQRFTHTVTVSNAASQLHPVRPDDLGDVYVWGAQLEEGTTATDYIPTTSTISGAPRFDHNPDTGESLGLLIEEARTNTILNSDNATGSVIQGTLTLSLESVVTPRGIAEDVRKVELVGTGAVLRMGPGAGNGASNTTYSVSFWIKSVDGGTGSVNIDINDRNTSEVPYTGEWTRITRSGGNRSDIGHQFFDLTQRASTTDFYLFGVQIEEGSFPTSYIPTNGSTVTRAADIAEITGADFAKTNLLQYSERFDDDAWFKAGSTTITPNTIAAPDGSITAETFNRNNTGTGNYLDSRGVSKNTAPVTYTWSLFVKKNDARYASLRLQGTYPSRADVVFDLDTGTVAVDANSFSNFSNASGSIQSSGNSWFRVSLTATSDSLNEIKALFGCSAESVPIDGTSSVANSAYIWGAQLEESDVLTDYTPSVETFVSRASSATYVDDATGLIKTTPVNLVTYSEEFDQINWANRRTVDSVTTETLDPLGGSTATKLLDTTDNNTHRIDKLLAGGTLSANTTYTLSVFAKQAEYSHVSLTIGENSNTSANVTFDLNAGVKSSETAGYTGFIESVGGGWYRCFATVTLPSAVVTQNALIGLLQDASTLSFAGTGTSGVYLWGAQLEEGSTATPYIKTGSAISGAARFENNQLILEEARTNFIDRNTSNYNSIWTTNVPPGAYNNAGIAPDGTNTAFATTDYGTILRGQKNYTIGITGEDYTYSIFIKSPSGQGQFISHNTGWNGGDRDSIGNVIYDFSTDTVGHGYSRKLYANGWVRVSKTYRQTNNGTFVISTSAQNSTDFLYWGAQLEKGSYPSSLIITPDGANVTRAADVSTSALGVDSFYNQTEGTMFVEALNYAHPITGTALVPLSYSDNSFTNLIQLGGSTGSDVFNFDVISGGTQFRGILGNYSSDKLKSAGAYKVADQAGSLDGASVGTASPSSIPSTINRLDIGNNHTGGLSINGNIKRLTYFNTRLSDDKLKSITT